MTRKLPKSKEPTFTDVIPSTGQEITFKPFRVKEEKILLIAQQAGTTKDIIRALKQILSNCILDKIDVDKLATFDLEWLFLKLRAKSVNNIVELIFEEEDEINLETGKPETYKVKIDIEDVKIPLVNKGDNIIMVDDEIGIVMQYPTISIAENIETFENNSEMMEYFIINCIKNIFDNEEVHDVGDYSKEELIEFVDNLNVGPYEKIKNFFDEMPKLYHQAQYTTKAGETKTIELTSLTDFFTWG